MFKGQYPTEDTAFTVSSDHSDGFTDTHLLTIDVCVTSAAVMWLRKRVYIQVFTKVFWSVLFRSAFRSTCSHLHMGDVATW